MFLIYQALECHLKLRSTPRDWFLPKNQRQWLVKLPTGHCTQCMHGYGQRDCRVRQSNTANNRRSCSSFVTSCIMMSSAIFTMPSHDCNTSLMMCWYCSGADDTPNISRSYLNNPWCIISVVTDRLSSCSGIWWKPHFKSSLVKTLLQLSSVNSSSLDRTGYLSCWMAWLA